jgi:hypothetical protein
MNLPGERTRHLAKWPSADNLSASLIPMNPVEPVRKQFIGHRLPYKFKEIQIDRLVLLLIFRIKSFA